MSGEKAEAIHPVDLGDGRSELGEGRGCFRIENSFSDTLHIAGDSIDAMGVDTAEVGSYETFGDNGGIMVWHIISF
jgi:hypothetical protein